MLDDLTPLRAEETAMLNNAMIRRFAVALALLIAGAGFITQVSSSGHAAVFPSHSGR